MTPEPVIGRDPSPQPIVVLLAPFLTGIRSRYALILCVHGPEVTEIGVRGDVASTGRTRSVGPLDGLLSPSIDTVVLR